MLVLKNINKTYNKGTISESQIFKDFSLSIEEGSFVTIIGSNGSGKSTLLNLICGTIGLTSGDITLDNVNISALKEHRRSQYMGRVFQDPSLGTCSSMTVLENMAMADNKNSRFGLTLGVSKDRIEFYKEQLARLNLGLEDKIYMEVGLLSGGQRQALALLMSTMSSIKCLILDEHTAALDPNISENIIELTDEIVRIKKITTLMVTHNLRHAVKYGDRLLMMHQGEVIMDLDKDEKNKANVDVLLDKFFQISIETGNSL